MKIGRLFGLDEILIEKAEKGEAFKQGKVATKVTMHNKKTGKTYQQTLYLRPGQKPPEGAEVVGVREPDPYVRVFGIASEAPKPEAPKPEAPKPEAPKPEAPKPEAPKPEAPKPEAPKKPKRMIQTEPVEEKKPEAPKAEEKPPEKTLPAKGAVLKERGVIEEAATAEKKLPEGYEAAKSEMSEYFKIQNEIRGLKGQIEEKAKAMEERMSRIRPWLAKLENLEKKEGKFKAKFQEDGFEYEFSQFTRTTYPYSDLYTKAFAKLSAEQQEELRGVEKALQKITSQEKFERKEPVAKSLIKAEDPGSKLEEHLKNLVGLKEKGLRLFQRLMTDSRKTQKSLRYVVMTNELAKAKRVYVPQSPHHKAYTRMDPRTVTYHPMTGDKPWWKTVFHG
jgi:hypothetical protein